MHEQKHDKHAFSMRTVHLSKRIFVDSKQFQ